MKIVLYYRSTSEYKSDTQIKSEITYIFSGENIYQKKGKSNAHFEWNDIISVYEHQDMYLLYVSKYKAIIVPKRFFVAEGQEELFKQIVSNNITTPKVKWL